MTIHSDHPFIEPEAERDPVRRLRGRTGGTVALWTAGDGPDRAGLTVSSYLVAAGEPARIVGLLHPDSDLLDMLREDKTAVFCLLEWRHRELAEVFAGLMPAPGGPFRRDAWEQTSWGPRLLSAGTWAGLRLDPECVHDVGWSVLVEAVVEHVEIGPDAELLVHRRGRYLRHTD